MALRNLDPSVGNALEEFPEEASLPPRDGKIGRAIPPRARSEHHLIEFPADRPVNVNPGHSVASLPQRSRRSVRMRSVLPGNVDRIQWFLATVVFHVSKSIGFGTLALASVILGLIMLPLERRVALPATLTASWIPLAIPAASSIERPPTAQRRTPDRNEVAAVQRTLNSYRDAFSVLDIGAVKAVWPSADEGALRTAFAGLYDQNVEFDSCRISVEDQAAVATCRGSVSYVRSRQVGRRYNELKQWQFTLVHEGDGWIVRTAVDSYIRAER